VGSWHVDPQRRDLVAEYSNERLRAVRETSYLSEALRRGKPVVIASGATEAVTKGLRPGRASELLLELAPESGAVLPLRGRERTVGLLTLFRGESREPMQTADLTTAMSVAFRAGLALDNARLYHQQRDLAAGLQRTMLTEPPQLDDVEIAVRYQPAARAAAVGGDWYDSFVQGTGETVLVIGDVVGHDVEAAAAMGQLRGLLRGIAFHSGSGPAQVLSGLDSAMDGLRMNLTATAVVARLEHPVADDDLGTTRLCWSNAGHPPPMVLRPDGSIELLAFDEPDLLLGLDPWTHRHQCDATLPHGSTVLLYTDGLTERRAQSLDTGLSRLRQALQELGGLELDALCDEVLRRLLPDQAEDDVALVAVRLHHPGRPRPEAR
jgi:serine phosphatase RsbU (regulator of sigma subunit)